MTIAHLVFALTLLTAEVTPATSEEAAAEAALAKRFDPFMALLDAHRVRYVVGARGALYLEAEQAWLCWWGGNGKATCHVWPQDVPRITKLAGWSDEQASRLHVHTATLAIELQSEATSDGLAALGIAQVRCNPPDDQLAYTMPPSRRPKVRPKRCDPENVRAGSLLAATANPIPVTVAQLFVATQPKGDDGNNLALTSIEHAGTSLVTMGEGSDALGWSGSWTCYRLASGSDVGRTCGATDLANFQAMSPESTLPEGWLLAAHSEYGRSAESHLVWVTAVEGKLMTAKLPVGAAEGIGEDCAGFFPRGHVPGYCMQMNGGWTPFSLAFPTCVQIRSTIHWSAVHVRDQRRWAGEKLVKLPPGAKAGTGLGEEWLQEPPKPGTYRPTPAGWVRADCWPAKKPRK
jgi:hypothetical protein